MESKELIKEIELASDAYKVAITEDIKAMDAAKIANTRVEETHRAVTVARDNMRRLERTSRGEEVIVPVKPPVAVPVAEALLPAPEKVSVVMPSKQRGFGLLGVMRKAMP